MSNPTYYLIANGNGFSPDGTIPEGGIECTQEQHANASAWTIKDGKITPYWMGLDDARALQASAIKAACQDAITGGFTSSALGSAYTYPSDDVAQRNISMCAIEAGLLWCETAGTWAMVEHTVPQAQLVQKDLFSMIQANQAKYQKLLLEIGAAMTVSAVQGVCW